MFDELYVEVNELDQSFEEYASSREYLVASNLYVCDFKSRLFLRASLTEISKVKSEAKTFEKLKKLIKKNVTK